MMGVGSGTGSGTGSEVSSRVGSGVGIETAGTVKDTVASEVVCGGTSEVEAMPTAGRRFLESEGGGEGLEARGEGGVRIDI